MCYYARTDYDCRDWKWGNMMLRCPRQHRIGETCGAKLVHSESVTKGGSLCKVCEEIEIKKRRYIKTCENISRWEKEPDKFSASLDKARREAGALREKIKELHVRRPSVASNLNVQATPTPVTNALPPISMTGSAPAYEYSSPNATVGRRQEQTSQPAMRTSLASQLPPATMMTYTQTPTMQQQQTDTYPRFTMTTSIQQGRTPSNINAYSMNKR